MEGTEVNTVENSEEINLTHEELVEVTTTTLNELIVHDSFLSDLPKGVTLEEVNSQIALAYGRSMKIFVRRNDGRDIHVVVPHVGATVADLKRGIKRSIDLQIKRESKTKKKLSWKYIWRTYYLQYHDVTLTDDNVKLSELGLKNKSTVIFVKRRKNKITMER